MATAQQETAERRQTAPEKPSSASPLDRHTPPTAGAGRRPGRAVSALILGIISIPAAFIAIVGLIMGVIAVVLGATARSDIRRHRLEGEGQATAAVVLGSVGIVLSIANMIAGAIPLS